MKTQASALVLFLFVAFWLIPLPDVVGTAYDESETAPYEGMVVYFGILPRLEATPAATQPLASTLAVLVSSHSPAHLSPQSAGRSQNRAHLGSLRL